MSDEEFLARWSHRKREAKAAHAVPGPSETGPTDPVEANSPAPSDPTAEPANREFDLSSLPPIESIAAATDVTAFLRGWRSAGVEACGASSRLDRRSCHPGFRRACRERLGLQ